MSSLPSRLIPGFWVVEAILHALWELLVEDVQLAAGTVAALVLAGLAGFSGGPGVREHSGWVLLVLLVALVMLNLHTAGRRARRWAGSQP